MTGLARISCRPPYAGVAAPVDTFATIRYYLLVPTIKKGAIPMLILLIVLAVLVLVGLLVVVVLIGMYNRLVTLRNRYKNAFSQIDVQLKRRYDLIPNLVEVAKGYIKHERETLEAVIKARNAASAAGQQAAKAPGDPVAMTALGTPKVSLPAPGAAVRRGRGLSRPEGQSEHARPARGALRHGEQDRLCPAGL